MNQIKQLFWISLIVKLVLAAMLPLTNDEAYYWVWSRHLQLSYYDHPPVVAWLYWLGNFTDWTGGSVRWPGVLLGHATLAIGLRVLSRFLTPQQCYYWLWMVLLSPLVGGSSLLVTPDLPLMFFYSVTLWMFFKWQEQPGAMTSALLGLSIGAGFTSKYMMVLFGLGLLPLLVVSRPVRTAFKRWWFLIVLGIIIGTLPVWLWNVLNDFASFKFQTAHGLGRKFWKPSWTIHYVLAQIFLIFPPILYWAMRSRRTLPVVFHFLAWTPLVFFFFTTFRGYVEANWPIGAYPLIFALAASQLPRNLTAIRMTLGLWGTLMAVLAAVVIVQPDWSKKLKFREFHQFDGIVERSVEFEPVYARSYQMAAKMHFELKRPVYKLRGMNRRDFYDYLEGSKPKDKIYYLAVEKGDALPAQYRADGHTVMDTIAVDDRFEIWKVTQP